MADLNIETVKETVAEDAKEKVDNAQEEDALYAMAESEGWRIMMKKYHKKIAEYLEPIQHEDISLAGNLELIGAMAIARREKIDALTEFINQVESVKNARREMIKKQKETPE